jgi:hypothetical protein
MTETTATATFTIINSESPNYFEKKIGETMTIFGILSIKSFKPDVCPPPSIINIEIDNSMSMERFTSFGQSISQQELVNTVTKNLTKTIAAKCPGTAITISSFDDTHIIVQPLIEITSETLESIKQKIDTIVPTGSTSLELPIKHLKEQTTLQQQEGGQQRNICNILLTDGEETVGIADPETLAQELCSGVPYAFVGVGYDCDHVLLNTLADSTPDGRGEFYFVKEIEDISMIMGKIFAEFLYTLFINIEITIEHGEIFNFATNTWSNKLHVSKLIHGITRNFHIRTNEEDVGKVSISMTLAGEQFCKVFGQDHVSITTDPMIYEMARFVVLDMLHNASFGSVTKSDVRELFDQVEQWSATASYLDQKLSQRLLNNLFVAFKNLDSPYIKEICKAQIKINGNENSFINNFETSKKIQVFPSFQSVGCDLFVNHCARAVSYDCFGREQHEEEYTGFPTDCSGNFFARITEEQEEDGIKYNLLPLFSKEHSSEEEIMFMTSASDGIQTDRDDIFR